MLKSPFYPGDLVTRTGGQEISANSRIIQEGCYR